MKEAEFDLYGPIPWPARLVDCLLWLVVQPFKLVEVIQKWVKESR